MLVSFRVEFSFKHLRQHPQIVFPLTKCTLPDTMNLIQLLSTLLRYFYKNYSNVKIINMSDRLAMSFEGRIHPLPTQVGTQCYLNSTEYSPILEALRILENSPSRWLGSRTDRCNQCHQGTNTSSGCFSWLSLLAWRGTCFSGSFCSLWTIFARFLAWSWFVHRRGIGRGCWIVYVGYMKRKFGLGVLSDVLEDLIHVGVHYPQAMGGYRVWDLLNPNWIQLSVIQRHFQECLVVDIILVVIQEFI
jgi:hypothetical protein